MMYRPDDPFLNEGDPMKNIISVLIGFILAIIICAIMSSCATHQPDITNDMFIHDTLRIVNIQHDSIDRYDSIYLREWVEGDTVFKVKYKYKYIYRDRYKVDTCYKALTDTITTVYEKNVEVEKKLSWWQKVQMGLGDFCLFVWFIALIIFASKYIKNRPS